MYRVVLLTFLCFFISSVAAFQLRSFDENSSKDGSVMMSEIKNKFFDSDEIRRQLMIYRNQSSDFQCVGAFLELMNWDIKSLQFFDAWGKFPSGLLYGHTFDLGNFDECLAIEKLIEFGDFTSTIRGKYALLQFNNKSQAKMATFFLDTNETTLLTIGSCFPHICTDESILDITKILFNVMTSNSLNESININLRKSVTMQAKDYDSVSIVALCIFSAIAFLMVLSTTYDYVASRYSGKPNLLFISFSVLTNGKKLFQITGNSSKSKSNIDCLNGIRVLSMVWVIFGHTHLWTSFFPLENSADILDWMRNPYAMLLFSGTVSVDSFLLMSGILITWVGLTKLEKSKGRLNILLVYMHRYLRLTPVLAAAILFAIGIMNYLGNGPFWSDFIPYLNHACYSNWWLTLLYINNYVKPKELCLGHTWYLSVDTQLFLISPFVLLGFYKWKSKFVWILLLLIGASYGCCINTMMVNKFNGVLTGGLLDQKQTEKIYYATHIRMPPWIIGAIVGFVMFQQRNHNKTIPKPIVIGLWLLAIAVLNAVIFGPYHFARDATNATPLEAAAYEAFGRSSWALSLAWIIYSCHMGYSETINGILSHPVWQPFARISYVMYLTSVFVQCINAGLIRTPKHFSNYDLIQTWWAELGITFCVSVLMTLAFESPIIAIEKYFLSPRKPKKEIQLTNSEIVVEAR